MALSAVSEVMLKISDNHAPVYIGGYNQTTNGQISDIIGLIQSRKISRTDGRVLLALLACSYQLELPSVKRLAEVTGLKPSRITPAMIKLRMLLADARHARKEKPNERFNFRVKLPRQALRSASRLSGLAIVAIILRASSLSRRGAPFQLRLSSLAKATNLHLDTVSDGMKQLLAHGTLNRLKTTRYKLQRGGYYYCFTCSIGNNVVSNSP